MLDAAESTPETGRQAQTKLLEGFDAIYFQYYAPGPGLSGGSQGWTDEWTDDAMVPERVRLGACSERRKNCAFLSHAGAGAYGPAGRRRPIRVGRFRFFRLLLCRKGGRSRMRSTSVDERGRNRRHPPGSDKGIALLVVLWLIVILTAIVFSFSFLTRTETHAALSFGRDVEEEFLAEAGMKRAVAEILRRSTLKGGQAAAGELDIVRVDGTVVLWRPRR